MEQLNKPPARTVRLPIARSYLIAAIAIYMIVLVLSLWPPSLSIFSSTVDYLPWHTVMEFFAIAVAYAVFGVAWSAYKEKHDRVMVIVGCGFLAVGTIDLVHTLTYSGMPPFFGANSADKAIGYWLWARYTAALLLISVALLPAGNFSTPRGRFYVLATALVYVVFIVALETLYREWRPAMYVDGAGLTTAKRSAEYFVLVLYLLAAFLLWRDYANHARVSVLWLVGACMVMTLSEVNFTLYFDVSDINNVFGHVCKVIAYYFVYRGLFVASVHEPYDTLRHTRRKLMDANVRFDEIFTNVTDAIVIVDVDLNVKFFNNAAAMMFGISATDACGKSVNILLPERFRERHKSLVQNFAHRNITARGPNKVGRVTALRHDGTEFPADATISRALIGDTVYLTAIIRDMTAAVAAEQAIRMSEDRFRSLTEATSDWVWEVDENAKYTYASPKIRDILGFEPSEVIGKTPFDFMPIDEAKRVGVIFNSFAARHEAFTLLENTNRAKDGKLVVLESSGVPVFDVDRQFKGYRGIDRDVTSRKQAERHALLLEKQLAQTARMEAIGQLSGGVAHDFNNILGAILGYADIASMRLNSSKPDLSAVDRDVHQIKVAGERAKELIQKLLTFSRQPQVADGVNLPVVALDPLIEEVNGLLRSMPSGIRLDYACHDNSLKAKIEPVQMHQVLINLCVNARDAIGEHGVISVALRRETHSDQCASCHGRFVGEYAVVSVADDGCGISDKVLVSMFQPFFTTKAVGKGTGMGLALVHGIVHSVGGHIMVESVVGEGTMISILLPIVTDEAVISDRIAATTVALDLHGKYIYVVDDEHAISTLLEQRLSPLGAIVASFDNGVSALRAIDKTPNAVDLLITDITMPEMSGIELAGAVRAKRQKLPVILMTGNDIRLDLASTDQYTVLLTKPFTIAQLDAAIALLMRN